MNDSIENDSLRAKYRILKYFRWEHLPPHLQAVSKPFAELAYHVAGLATNDPAETAVALRKLREAKDCAVCSVLP